MRLRRLELAAFGPFQGEHELDFDALAEDGLSLIAGPTGAGKSSILDAVSFALYGTVPRYEGTGHIRSDFARPDQPTRVELDLLLGERELRVRRSPAYDRPKKGGRHGTTTEKATAQLLERVDGSWVALAQGPAEVGAEVLALVGLTAAQFQQVILLAQGRFARFLAATTDERKALLQSLFGTQRFAALRELLRDDARRVHQERHEIEQRLLDRASQLAEATTITAANDAEAPDPEGSDVADTAPAHAADIDEAWVYGRLETLHAAVEPAAAAASAAKASLEGVRSALDAARDVERRRERRAAALSQRAALEARADEHAASVAELDAARRAAQVRPALDAAETAAAVVEDRQSALEARTAPALAALDGEALTIELAAAARDRAAALAHRLVDAVELEGRLPQLEREAERAAQHELAARTTLASITEERAALPARRAALADELAAAAAESSGRDEAAARLDRAREAHDARRRARALEPGLEDARARLRDRVADDEHAGAALRARYAARLAGAASVLAGELRSGSPCPVCGSLEHPSPAAAEATQVTDVELAEAERLADAARAAMTAASATLSELEQSHAAELARSGTDDDDALTAAVADAELLVARAQQATDRAASLTRELERCDETDAALERRAAEHAAALEAAVTASAAAARSVSDARERVERERADHPSVAERAEHAGSRAAALEAWLRAADDERRAVEARDAATHAGTESLALHGFADADAARGAERSQAALTELEQAVRRFDTEFARVTGVLEQPELQDLGEHDLGIAALLAELASADAEAERTAAAAAQLEARLRSAEQLAAGARDLLAALSAGADAAAAIRSLAASLHGEPPNTMRMDIETYVLAARLESIIEAANRRLAQMTGSRFALEHDDSLASHRRGSGLGIAVLDAHTGRARPTSSLSGGETFLASLALALGLADVVQAEAGGIALETLFVDEGFGSLDAETLESALAALDELRAGGRSVAVISHVPLMQERIPARIRVEPLVGGGSTIVQHGPADAR